MKRSDDTIDSSIYTTRFDNGEITSRLISTESKVILNPNSITLNVRGKNLFDNAVYVPYNPMFDYDFKVVDQNNNIKKDIKGLKKKTSILWNGGNELPEKVIVNKKNTIFEFGKNDKTLLRCSEYDEFNLSYAFLYAYFLKNSGMSKTQAAKFFSELTMAGFESQLKKTELKVDKNNDVIQEFDDGIICDMSIKDISEKLKDIEKVLEKPKKK